MSRVKKSKILVKPEDIKPSSNLFEVMGVFNPGAIRLKDGRIVLYVRVMEKLKKMQAGNYFFSPRFVGKDKFKIKLDKFRKKEVVSDSEWDFAFEDGTKRLTSISHFRRVFLDKYGLKVLKIEKKPGFFGILKDAELGIEDARITKLDGKYYMTYVGLSRNEGVSTYLAVSNDGLNWQRKGIIFGEQDKDVVLFSEKIKGEYVAFDRPEGSFNFKTPRIWIAYSKDLLHWGRLKGMNISKSDRRFRKSGAGPPPIKTEKGWVFFFHVVTIEEHKDFFSGFRKVFGLHEKPGEEVYGVWVALLDKDNPEKIISKSHYPLFYPRGKEQESLERKKVIFPTGIVEDLDKKHFLIYSGEADIYTSVAKVKKKMIFNSLGL